MNSWPVLLLLVWGQAAWPADSSLGAAVYKKRCSGCHEQTSPRIPHSDALRRMPASKILRSLDFGLMMSVAYPMNRDERTAVASYLGATGHESPIPAAAYCNDRTVSIAQSPKFRWNGWSASSGNTRFQPIATGRLRNDAVPKLQLKWAFGYEGDVTAFAQPTVLDNYLFTGSAGGLVYALNARSGCIHWTFQASGPVRASILAVKTTSGYALLFGDQTGWFYSLDASNGRQIWKKKIEDHDATRLTGAAVAHAGTVFIPVASWEETRALSPDYPCCTFRGSVVALRASDGAQVWKTYTVGEPQRTGKNKSGTPIWGPSGAGIWSAPTIDTARGLLYVTTGDNYSSPGTETSDAVLALDLKTGAIQWSRQMTAGDVYNSACFSQGANCPAENGPDHDFGASAMLVRAGNRQLLIAGQKSGVVYALDPARRGEIAWQTRVGKGGVVGGVQWGMAADAANVYAAVSDVAFIRKANRGPLDLSYREVDPLQGGGLTALRIVDGSRAWHAPPATCPPSLQGCSPAQSAAVTAIPGAVFSGSLDGHLRAYSDRSGEVIWDFDTAREFQTVNGVAARGGSLDGPGAVVVDGMLYVVSGYSRFGGMPGNVLLAFAPVGKGNQ